MKLSIIYKTIKCAYKMNNKTILLEEYVNFVDITKKRKKKLWICIIILVFILIIFIMYIDLYRITISLYNKYKKQAILMLI